MLLSTLGGAGCGGGSALMHPAHALPPDRTTLGAGVSSQFVLGRGSDQIQAARTTMSDDTVLPSEEPAFVEGALAQALLAPGLAPWVGARAGLGFTSDAGVSYTGRSMRVDGRHAFESDSVAASIGLGGSYVMKRPGHDGPSDGPGGSDETVPGLDTGYVWGVGADLPILVGYRSQADLLQVWTGARFGYERLRGDVILRIDPALSSEELEQDPLEAERFYALAVVGLALSVHPVSIVVELDAGYQRGEGSIRRPDGSSGLRSVGGTVEGVSVTPTAALVGRLWD